MGRLKNKKTIPTFNKPSTSLNSNHGKVWKNVRADELEAGDIVANYGAVIYTQISCRDDVSLEMGYPDSKTYFFPRDTIFFAFVKKG